MKSAKFYWTFATWAAAACLAILFVTPALSAQETKEKITVDDVDRTFMLRLPKGYDPQHHYPVVILLHGISQDADDMERLTQFDQLADKDGIIAIYPIALNGRWNVGVRPQERRTMGPGGGRGRHGGGFPGGGYPGGGGGGGGYPRGSGGGYPGGQQPSGRDSDDDKRPLPADDVAFISQMLDQVSAKQSVDPARIYAAGLSEGGFMSLRLGCALGDRLAAVAAVSAAMPKTMTCLPPRPVAVVMINGTSDPIVHYGGGTERNLNLEILSVEESAKAWARIDHCSEKPEHSKAPSSKGGTEAKVDTYTGCREGAEVVSYSLKGTGNTWPGGMQYEPAEQIGKTSEDFNANENLWAFLASKKLPAKSDASQ
jgi:polyhydroxybutyrate depolymerase